MSEERHTGKELIEIRKLLEILEDERRWRESESEFGIGTALLYTIGIVILWAVLS